MKNAWAGDQQPDVSALIPISPYLFGQRKLRNIYYLPKLRDLPQHGLEFAIKVFDFGFNAAANVIQPFDTAEQSVVLGRNLVIWGINGTSDSGASPALLFNIFHTHDGKQLQFFNKNVTDVEQAGSGSFPHILPHPYLAVAQDTLTCQLQNLTGVDLKAQIALLCSEFDG